ncbi:NADH-quinone oxidoreductase subunit C [Streptomyces sp. NPDC006430]|uniref:NADH-quinone oxidoreductase subunit C n=1 Tax=Streptomyces sp. NPDC006430 TaxID=3154299 RepID=UPI0033B3A08C
MNLYDSLPGAVATIFGAEAVAEHAYDVLTVDVPVGSWIPSLEIARDKLGCTYFDWLSAVDEPGTGFRVCAHVVSLENHRVRRLLLRTTVPHGAPSLPSAVSIYAGAEWHERETFEMFGVRFTDHPHLVPLLLPENFEGHPLRKDFVLAARVAKAWPGAKEPGEAHDPDAPKRRQMLPPGVPDPNDWGPLKGQLPPAPSRPARTARAPREGAPARTPREGAPVRRTRTAAEGSATQAAEAEATPRPARRTRSVTDGSASQAVTPADTGATPATPPTEGPPPSPAAPRPARRTRSAGDGSVSQSPAPEPGPGSGGLVAPGRRPAPRSTDAPWHNPKPAFEEPERKPEPEPGPEPASGPESAAGPEPAPERGPEGEAGTSRSGEGEAGSGPTTHTTEPDNGGDA